MGNLRICDADHVLSSPFSLINLPRNANKETCCKARDGGGRLYVLYCVCKYSQNLGVNYKGMMIAIPEPEWNILYAMSTTDLAAILFDLARRVRLQACRKSS